MDKDRRKCLNLLEFLCEADQDCISLDELMRHAHGACGRDLTDEELSANLQVMADTMLSEAKDV